jgi:hypothetical protein
VNIVKDEVFLGTLCVLEGREGALNAVRRLVLLDIRDILAETLFARYISQVSRSMEVTALVLSVVDSLTILLYDVQETLRTVDSIVHLGPVLSVTGKQQLCTCATVLQAQVHAIECCIERKLAGASVHLGVYLSPIPRILILTCDPADLLETMGGMLETVFSSQWSRHCRRFLSLSCPALLHAAKTLQHIPRFPMKVVAPSEEYSDDSDSGMTDGESSSTLDSSGITSSKSSTNLFSILYSMDPDGLPTVINPSDQGIEKRKRRVSPSGSMSPLTGEIKSLLSIDCYATSLSS